MRGVKVMFVTVPDLLDYLRIAFNPNSTTSLDRRLQIVRNAEMLVLDDLGTESATPWAKEKLYQLLNYRYVTNMPTVITSALALEKIDERIRTRLMDQHRCIVFAITAPPYSTRTFQKWRK